MWHKHDEYNMPEPKGKIDYETELRNDSGYLEWTETYWLESMAEIDRNTPTNLETDK